jgi:hypothetical protein
LEKRVVSGRLVGKAHTKDQQVKATRKRLRLSGKVDLLTGEAERGEGVKDVS